MGELAGKVALVTGAASGIGKAIAQAFHHAGARVVIADLDRDAAEEAAGEIDGGRGDAMGVVMDVADEEAVLVLVAPDVARADRDSGKESELAIAHQQRLAERAPLGVLAIQ